jgi:hypothetical protein
MRWLNLALGGESMKPLQYVAVFGVLNALAFSSINDSAHAAQAKGRTSQRGGKAAIHMSVNGQENTNAQWSADPDRGWVRAEERQNPHQQGQGTLKNRKTRTKQVNERKVVKHNSNNRGERR